LVINGAGFERWADDIEAKVVANTSEGSNLIIKKKRKRVMMSMGTKVLVVVEELILTSG
jgi:hypothetical protein